MHRSSLRRPAGILVPLLAALTAVAAVAQPAGDGPWAQFRGPERTGISRENGLLKQWPAGGPSLVWKASGLGTGNSTPSVAGGRIFGMSYRGNEELVWALEETTGKPIWSERIAPATFDIGRQAHDGSGGTPTVDGDRLYSLGMGGDLVCMQVSDGKLLWQKNLVKEFGGAVPKWGYAESPLVDGNKVIVSPGGREATLVALDRMTGEVIWKSQVPQGDAAGYSSAIAAEIQGQRQYVQFLGGGVVGVDAESGGSSGATTRPPTGSPIAAPRSSRGIRSSPPPATTPAAGWRR